ncbi:triose-phosphate isomerase family protein [Subtercola boreus]|uniref:Triosephosphate isomerase n=1 Tax=Subtercola boreus TaxID=120213 RepID=A0A3E0W711_9MICO|nr:triose-phosphate isomerase family protein [Subtercola boreus]RFA18029.1 triose-phosphate isomerase [Subtercola boreus]RFA18411.1 triose-phosphate isomerase [Subtercola boreus]RFA24940.1 triose-phosphate isomerase [Subtercola boreus]
MTNTGPALTIGVSTKMYFSFARTIEYAEAMAGLASSHPAVTDGTVELFVIPSYPTLPEVVRMLSGTPVRIGAQDVATDDSGAFTGEVSAPMLAEIGCTLAEVGHAERRRLFGETEEVTAAKTQAALRNGITPVLCLGEAVEGTAPDAAAEVIRQLDSALQGTPRGSAVIVAYEPHWAIGAAQPAPAGHIVAVCRALRDHLDADERLDDGRVIYGGSAGPGLLTTLGRAVDGIFLGRFAHDPAALGVILDEAASLHQPES